VTSIGHAHPVIRAAPAEQGALIFQNPDPGPTWVCFTNSGAESNDAAVKPPRKVAGREDVVATDGSLHGRTISMVSATSQARRRDKFRTDARLPLRPTRGPERARGCAGRRVAAVIVEPIQGEGGVRIPSADCSRTVSELCRANGALLMSTGSRPASAALAPVRDQRRRAQAGLLTMVKGIAGGGGPGAPAGAA